MIRAPLRSSLLLIAAFSLPITGCVFLPVSEAKLRHAGVPARHIQKPALPVPFDPAIYEGLMEHSESGSGGSRGSGGGINLGSLDFNFDLSFLSDCDGEAALVILGVLAVVVVGVVVVYALAESGALDACWEACKHTFYSACYVGYSVPAGATLVASHATRLAVWDAPEALLQWLRSKRGQIEHDLISMVRVWKGQAYAGNPVLAVRSSGERILFYARRLEYTTGRKLGVNPAEWIRYYERHYGPWRWERP